MSLTINRADLQAGARAEALAVGASTYFTGKPCSHGHIAARYARNGTCLVCRAATITAWREVNRDKKLADARRWNQENYPRAQANTLKWRAANPEKVRAMDLNKKAKRRAAEGRHTHEDIAAIRARQSDKCAHPWCRADIKKHYHVDHIIALARGGTNWRTNLQLLCRPCNQSKHAKHPIDVAQAHGMLL